MDRYIEDYEFTFDDELNERSRSNTIRFCNEWWDFIYLVSGLDINRMFWEDVPVVARFVYIKTVNLV
jgi:hypothetical protein